MKKAPFVYPLTMVAALGLAVLFLSGTCIAAEFSADLVIKPQGEPELVGKISVKNDRVRQEMEDEGEKQIMIIRPDKGVTWMITPEEKMYLEVPYQEGERVFEEWSPEKDSKAKQVGEETVSGFKCNKYETEEEGEKVYFWISQKFPFPLRVQDSEVTMEYRNIKETSLSDSLFEIPSGYEKMTMPPMPEDEETPKG